MKKQLCKLTALAILLVFTAVLAMPEASAAAQEGEAIVVTAFDHLRTISEMEEKSLTSGVVSVALGETHCAVLFADGTVSAVQSGNWCGCFDYGECDTSDWSGIQKIACRAECTFGLKQDGSIIWAGKPEIRGYDGGTNSLDDDGWEKISKGKNYVDIACQQYTPLYALNADGTVDVAFGLDDDAVKELTNIIDIESTDWPNEWPGLATLASDGTVRVFQYAEEPMTFVCEGAQKICMRERRLCAIMENGDVQYLAFDPGSAFAEHRLVYEAVNPCDILQSQGTVSRIWVPESCAGPYDLRTFIARMDEGDVYCIQQIYYGSGIGGDYAIRKPGKWENLQNAYAIAFDLKTSPEYWSQELEIILGVMEDGTLHASYAIPMPPLG